jgi:alcohol dehydrogenase class IV
MWGAHLAGRAINISKTTASHAMSYQLTTRYGTPHGVAAALTLGHLAAANAGVTPSTCADPRGVESVQQRVRMASQFLGVKAEEMPCAVADLLHTLGVPPNLKEAGVPREDLSRLAELVDPVRLGNNPRRMTTGELTQLLERAWGDGRDGSPWR